ncbi:hypothetical protein ACOMHN_042201 [Nucella lapillus]
MVNTGRSTVNIHPGCNSRSTFSSGRREGGGVLGSKVVVVVLVLVVCVWPCVWGQNKELSYTIYEEGPVPSMVGNIAKDSNVSRMLGSHIFNTLT